jgi:hypothetical protein
MSALRNRSWAVLLVTGLALGTGCTAGDFYGLSGEGCDVDGDASAGVQGSLSKDAGDGQTAGAGTPVTVRVKLLAVGGAKLCSKGIVWSTGAGSGTVNGSAITDAGGLGTASWTLGPAGPQTLTATITNSDPVLSVTFTATATGTAAHPIANIRAYNGTSTSDVVVTMQSPFNGAQSFGPIAPNTLVAKDLQVEAATQFAISATVGARTGSTTCTTTAAIIPDPADPQNTGVALAAVFTGETGNVVITCDGAWQSVPAP